MLKDVSMSTGKVAFSVKVVPSGSSVASLNAEQSLGSSVGKLQRRAYSESQGLPHLTSRVDVVQVTVFLTEQVEERAL